MTPDQIRSAIEQFTRTALLARESGFDGIEVHAAHGYLLSQFLSPLVNRREDAWGGSLRNRARLLLDIVESIRERTGAGFGLAVKLNSADFQRGGFDVEDAGQVIEWLSGSVDFVELSGGSVESLATAGHPADERTLAREAYFLDLAKRLAAQSSVPLMLTGGVRRRVVAEQVLTEGVELVGVATALAQDPELPHRWLAGDDAATLPPCSTIGSKAVRAAAVQAALTGRIHTIGCGSDTTARPPALALAIDRLRRSRQLRAYRKGAASHTG